MKIFSTLPEKKKIMLKKHLMLESMKFLNFPAVDREWERFYTLDKVKVENRMIVCCHVQPPLVYAVKNWWLAKIFYHVAKWATVCHWLKHFGEFTVNSLKTILGLPQDVSKWANFNFLELWEECPVFRMVCQLLSMTHYYAQRSESLLPTFPAFLKENILVPKFYGALGYGVFPAKFIQVPNPETEKNEQVLVYGTPTAHYHVYDEWQSSGLSLENFSFIYTGIRQLEISSPTFVRDLFYFAYKQSWTWSLRPYHIPFQEKCCTELWHIYAAHAPKPIFELWNAKLQKVMMNQKFDIICNRLKKNLSNSEDGVNLKFKFPRYLNFRYNGLSQNRLLLDVYVEESPGVKVWRDFWTLCEHSFLFESF